MENPKASIPTPCGYNYIAMFATFCRLSIPQPENYNTQLTSRNSDPSSTNQSSIYPSIYPSIFNSILTISTHNHILDMPAPSNSDSKSDRRRRQKAESARRCRQRQREEEDDIQREVLQNNRRIRRLEQEVDLLTAELVQPSGSKAQRPSWFGEPF